MTLHFKSESDDETFRETFSGFSWLDQITSRRTRRVVERL